MGTVYLGKIGVENVLFWLGCVWSQNRKKHAAVGWEQKTLLSSVRFFMQTIFQGAQLVKAPGLSLFTETWRVWFEVGLRDWSPISERSSAQTQTCIWRSLLYESPITKTCCCRRHVHISTSANFSQFTGTRSGQVHPLIWIKKHRRWSRIFLRGPVSENCNWGGVECQVESPQSNRTAIVARRAPLWYKIGVRMPLVHLQLPRWIRHWNMRLFGENAA